MIATKRAAGRISRAAARCASITGHGFETASVLASAALAAGAGAALLLSRLAGTGIPGWAAASALALAVFTADRWISSRHPFTRWLHVHPRRKS